MGGEQAAPVSGDAAIGMAERIRRLDWSTTALGPAGSWPPELRFALRLLERSTYPSALYWGPDLILLYNDAWAPIPADRHPWALGRPGREVWSDIWHVIGPQFAHVLETGEGFSALAQYLPMERNGVPHETYWDYSFTPVLGPDGRALGIFNQGHEVTRTVLTERRLSMQVRLADRLRGLDDPEAVKDAALAVLGDFLQPSRCGFAEVDEAGDQIVVRNAWASAPEIADMAGAAAPLTALPGPALALLRAGELLVASDIAAVGEGFAGAGADLLDGARGVVVVPLVRNGRLRALLFVHQLEPRRWLRSEAAVARDTAERAWAAVERAEAEQHRDLLTDELNHRVKNMLATVQAIAVQTLKGNVDMDEARRRFETRLAALARAHDLLVERSWDGAPIRRLVGDATSHLSPEHFEITGADLVLPPRGALALSLVLHELGTNAAKHGALSREAGIVTISWASDNGLLRLEWKERGGPPVTAPSRRGFGSRLIERGLAGDLGGGADLRFEPDGLRCVITAALPAGRADGS